MRSLLIQGDLIWEALQSDHPSEFDLLWQALQSTDLHGLITQADLDQLYVRIARTQGIDSATRIIHHVSRVLAVYVPEQEPVPDLLILNSTLDQSTTPSEIISLSVSAFLERYTLELLYQSQPSVGRMQHALAQWLRKSNDLGFDLLVIPIVLTLAIQSLDLFKQVLAASAHSTEETSKPLFLEWGSPSGTAIGSEGLEFEESQLSSPTDAEVERSPADEQENIALSEVPASEQDVPLELFFPSNGLERIEETLLDQTLQMFSLDSLARIGSQPLPSGGIILPRPPIQNGDSRPLLDENSLAIEADFQDIVLVLQTDRESIEREGRTTASDSLALNVAVDSSALAPNFFAGIIAESGSTEQIRAVTEEKRTKANECHLAGPSDFDSEAHAHQFALEEDDWMGRGRSSSAEMISDSITNPQGQLSVAPGTLEQESVQGLDGMTLVNDWTDEYFGGEEIRLEGLSLGDRSALRSTFPVDLPMDSSLMLDSINPLFPPLDNG